MRTLKSLKKNGLKRRHWLAFSALSLPLLVLATGCATPRNQAPSGQFYHIGLVWLKEPGNEQHRQKIIDATHSFAREIPEVKFVSVGKSAPQTGPWSDASFDLCFIMQLEDKAALERYAKHPAHQKAAEDLFLPLSKKFLFYDFISE